ncbi:hypothetical protein AQJ84_25495 [Streptomyces resistomycificus]|uniref:Uncharacterized protein n=1 Tax=Streptomyces resistomycificus TaxID=67356 RepID=A0A0L8L2A6_9ACTN|nr:hypothetical protein ADK37_27225 [Streptomyces resistomycificus]KUN94726.1 hypothetical protein AQJ84_25495 [Streptomyces resistomycificus]
MLETYVVDDEDEEFWGAVARLDPRQVPSLAGLDAYADTTLRGAAVERMVRELQEADPARLSGAERAVMERLLAWGLRCRAERDLHITFCGD